MKGILYFVLAFMTLAILLSNGAFETVATGGIVLVLGGCTALVLFCIFLFCADLFAETKEK